MPTCPFCQATILSRLYSGVRDRLRIAPDSYDFLACSSCGSAVLDPMPSSDRLAAFYPTEYTFSLNSRDRCLLSRWLTTAEYWLFHRPILLRRLSTMQTLTQVLRGRVLDVGCGSGLFLRFLKEHGYDVEGVDFSPSAVASTSQLGLTVHLGTLQSLALPSDSYHLAVLYSVLEHDPAPASLVAEVFRLLVPNGWIVLGLPLLDSLQARLFGSRWVAVTEAPRHTLLPTLKGLFALLRKSGFESIRHAPAPLLENASHALLSIIPAAAGPHARRRPLVPSTLSRITGLALLPTAVLLALAERLFGGQPPRAGSTMVAARKPS